MAKPFSTSTPFVLHALKHNPLFADLDEEALIALAEASTERNHAPGDIISPAQSPGNTLCLVRKGEVEVFLGEPGESETVMHVLRENEYFGELALLQTGERWATVRARQQSVVVYVPQETLHQFNLLWPDQHARVIGNLARELARRLKENGDVMADASRFRMWENG
jgi:CRP/FNR family transcriptional regulator, cyclic AMP receptor protein